jgi:hypothetical protein
MSAAARGAANLGGEAEGAAGRRELREGLGERAATRTHRGRRRRARHADAHCDGRADPIVSRRPPARVPVAMASHLY